MAHRRQQEGPTGGGATPRGGSDSFYSSLTPLIVRLINFKFRFRVLSGLKESLGTGGSILRIVNLLLVLYTTFIFNGSFKAPE